MIQPDIHQPRIALVSVAAARALDDDLAPLRAALTAHGAAVTIVDWDDADADWSRHDLAVLRSTWDYTARPTEFLAWAERTAAVTRLCNPLDVVRWNIDKHYLAELGKVDIPIVPSRFVAPNDAAHEALQQVLGDFPGSDIVVKPTIGAGSRDTRRHSPHATDAALAHIQCLQKQHRRVLLQPYLASVDSHGETALLYFNGQFSHAIRKGPLLQADAEATAELFAAEHIEPRQPSAAERQLAERIIASLPFAQTPTYARIDLIHDNDQQPRLLELELVEPSLFLDHAEGAAERFASALVACSHPLRSA